MRVHDLLIQQVFFVQEKNGGGSFEPRGGEDGLEQGEALLESILRVSEVSQNNLFHFFDISKKVLTEPFGRNGRCLGEDLTSFSFSYRTWSYSLMAAK